MTIITALRDFLSRFLAQRIAPPTTDPRDNTALPRTRSEVVQAAALLDLTIPDACMPGVEANLALLDTHARTLLHPSRRGDR